MEAKSMLLKDYLSIAWDRGNFSTDDVIAFLMPLIKKTLAVHETGQVIEFGEAEHFFVGDFLDVSDAAVRLPRNALQDLAAMFPRSSRELDVVGVLRREGDSELIQSPIHWDPGQPIKYPSYLPGYSSFEQLLGHHDPQTDIFSLGLLLGGMSLGLDLYKKEDLEKWVDLRSNPSMHQPRIHPTLGRLITEMTELDRSRRMQDLYEVIRRLQHYRDYDIEKQADLSQLSGWINKDLKEKGNYILNRLRNRLFDTSRRNRLLYYKPNLRFVNLTVGSVPLVLHYQSIRPDLLFTWNEELAGKIGGMKEIVLNKYLRFEDHAYLPVSLDRVRVESRRAVQEYGFSELKLVIAFLNWNNLKEDPEERIQSPLLLIPVELKKNKKLKEDHYVLQATDNAAEVNPVLAGQLKNLYGIQLPDQVDLDEMSPEQFYQSVRSQIDAINQGIGLHYIDKPRIMIMAGQARQTVLNYRKRMRASDAVTEPPIADTGATVPDTVIPSAGPDRAGFVAPPDPAFVADSFVLAESENNPYSWDIDVCNMVLGNFNYKKMSLVRDYNTVIDQELEHPVFNSLFSDQPRPLTAQPPDLDRPGDWNHVITADPTQTRAILESRAGYSYIIQGPPGTGKSQTITNLIADFVARGKSILFVCEKRAALDVVYHRLKQNGLDELCCYIHDSQADKKEFIKDLRSTYEAYTGSKMDLAAIRSKRDALVAKMDRQLDLLHTFHSGSKEGELETGIATRALMERIIGLRQDLPALSAGEEERLPAYAEWQRAREGIQMLAQALEQAGMENIFAAHPFSKINDAIFRSGNPHQLLDKNIREALDLLTQIAAMIRQSHIDPVMAETTGKLKTVIAFSTLLHPLTISGNRGLADPASAEAKELRRRMVEFRQKQELSLEAKRKNTHWRSPIPEEELQGCIDLATANEGRFLSFMNGAWKRLRQQVKERYDLSAHSLRPTILHLLEGLRREYEAAAKAEQTRRRLQQEYGIDNIEGVWLGIEILHNKKGEPALDYLLHFPDAVNLVGTLQAMRQPLDQLEEKLKICLQEPGAGSLSDLEDELQNIRLNMDSLQELMPALRTLAGLPETVRAAIRYFHLPPQSIEAAIDRQTLQQIYQSNRAFASIDNQAIEKAVQELGAAYRDLQTLNADLIRAGVRHRFLQQLDLAGLAASQLNEEQKKFKKIYNEGRRILENEFGKSMRFKSIRELSTRESGRVLRDLKPVWLMSPYSVSDSLPLNADHFDVVIFDEASQITVEEGVPALYRSRQTIIVGDERQMPPTDFFGARTEDPEDLTDKDPEDGDAWWNDDADSLLAQGARKLNSTLLSWHYRSHFETLISFSNHAFYGGALLTIPDTAIHHQQREAIQVKAAADAVLFTGNLFDRSISYHFHREGVYEKRSNAAEAGYIAELIRQLLNRDTQESVGIVAFSQEQQRTIEKALDDLADEDPVFGQKLEAAYTRTDQDQFTGLIVKNLENIQGDERDIIIMSVCYGYDARKKMLMNFGPINKKGGEKRLNVLFSRAKKHIAVVSSIHHSDITNEYNDGAGYLKKFLRYSEMVSMGQIGQARAVLDGLVPPQEKVGTSVDRSVLVRQLKQQILSLGYEVAEAVGQSGFKCSLAVRIRPEDEQYALGILIDDDRHFENGNLVEQYYLRPSILRDFGWRVLSVYAKDWLHQPQKVMDQIRGMLEAASQDQDPSEGRNGSAVETRNGAASANGSLASLPAEGVAGLDLKRYYYREGDVELFWEAATDGNKLVQRWGRVGTKGQVLQIRFPDEAAARLELDKQISERTEKGIRHKLAPGRGGNDAAPGTM